MLVALAAAAPPAPAQQSTPIDAPTPDAQAPAVDAEMQPTKLGLRFTPGMASAIAGQFTQQMTRRYELKTEQAARIREILAREMLRLSHAAEASGRDAVEFMIETMIANDGSFPSDAAQKFAQTLKPVMPALDRFFTDSAKRVSSQMTLDQRLKFTADSAAAVAGFAMFKNRMAKWEKGEVSGNVNPFFDRADDDPPPATRPGERHEVARARQRADDMMRWQVNQSLGDWEQYVRRAIAYYALDDAQSAAARAILKNCQDRAAGIRTPAWNARMKDNRMKRSLAFEVGLDYSSGPWMAQNDREYTEMMRPLQDLRDDLQRRIDALPTTAQRHAAQRRAAAEFGKLGVTLPGE